MNCQKLLSLNLALIVAVQEFLFGILVALHFIIIANATVVIGVQQTNYFAPSEQNWRGIEKQEERGADDDRA